MRKLLVIAFTVLAGIVNSQTLYNPPIVAFIGGNPNITLIDKDFFREDVELRLSDSSYEVVSFRITVMSLNRSFSAGVQGPIARITGSLDTLKRIDTNVHVVLEDIKIRKRHRLLPQDDTVRSLSFSQLKTTDAATAREHRQNLANCYVYLENHGTRQVFRVRELLSGDFILKLSDPSFTVLGAELEIIIGDELYDVPISGDRVGVNHPVAGQYLRRFKPGCSLIFTKIKAGKNGKIYDLKDVNVLFR